MLHASANGCLQLRLTKNDVWDARIDTSGDPELAVINPATREITKGGNPHCSWEKSYPCPLTCGVLEFVSAGAVKTWQSVRSEGSTNVWNHDGKPATMSIAGRPGASCGWQVAVVSDGLFDKIRLRLSGTVTRFFGVLYALA